MNTIIMAYNILRRQIWKLQKERGFTEEEARKIAYNQQKRLWRTQPWSFRLSKEGEEYSKLNPAQRALIRAAKNWTWNINDYVYLDWKVKRRWLR